MTDEYDKPMLRAVQCHYIDGAFELTFGGICLLRGYFFFIQAAIPGNPRQNEVQNAG